MSATSGLLEREGELAQLGALVDAAQEGAGRFTVVEGGAGVGKTRLLAAVRERGLEAGMRVLHARGGELERQFPYGVVRQLFEPVLAEAGRAERHEVLGGAAGLAVPLFSGDYLTRDVSSNADPAFATLHGLFWLTANLAAHRALVLAVDDLHWADKPSLRWLAYLVRRLEGLPVLVVACLRPREPGADDLLLAELLSDPAAFVVRPSPLSEASVAWLVHERLSPEADAEFCAACFGATGGNPLFVRELLNALEGRGIPPTAGEVARVWEIGPEGVLRSVRLRLSRLPSEATLLARAVAILGNDVELQHAAALAKLDRESAADSAAALGRADILRPELPLVFVHPVVRAAVHEEISPAERAAEHRRAAALLAEAGAEPERIASHLMLVPPGGDASVLGILGEAAARSVARGAADAAVAYLRRALEETAEDDARADVLAQLGMTERLVGTPAAAEHLGEAMRQTEDASRRAQLAVEYGRALWYLGRNREAIEVFQEAIGWLGPDRLEFRQLLEAELIGSSWWEAELYPAGQELLAKVSAEDLGGGSVSDVLLATLAHYETRRGLDRERAVTLAKRSLASGSLERESAVAIFYAAFAFSLAGETETAAAVYDRAVAESRRRGDIFSVGGLLGFRGLLATERGDLISAAEDLREAVEIMQLRGAVMNLQYYAAFLADLQLELGDIGQAEDTLALPDLGEQFPASVHLSPFGDARGKLRHEKHRPLEALADFTVVGRILESLEIHNPAFRGWRSHAALALHALGRDDEGCELAAEELELARRWGAPRPIGVALRTLGLVQGGREGESHLREAVEILAASTARLEHAKALTELGAALRRANRRAEARDPLRRGLEIAHSCGAKPLAERAHTELLATGARPRRLVVSGREALTPSERRVAAMAADGLTNRDIAQSLFVTARTVEVHLSGVYRKLGISSRSQLPRALAAPVAEVSGGQPAAIAAP